MFRSKCRQCSRLIVPCRYLVCIFPLFILELLLDCDLSSLATIISYPGSDLAVSSDIDELDYLEEEDDASNDQDNYS